jgi:hypothetical protein
MIVKSHYNGSSNAAISRQQILGVSGGIDDGDASRARVRGLLVEADQRCLKRAALRADQEVIHQERTEVPTVFQMRPEALYIDDGITSCWDRTRGWWLR